MIRAGLALCVLLALRPTVGLTDEPSGAAKPNAILRC
jgi:hypothetical protein